MACICTHKGDRNKYYILMEKHIDIIWYGRQGQGTFSAAKLLGAVFVFSGQHRFALAFPSIRPRRHKGSVRAYTKLASSSVIDRSACESADYIVVLDRSLLDNLDSQMLKKNTFMVCTTPAIEALCMQKLGRQLVGTALLAILVMQLGSLNRDDIVEGIKHMLPENIQAKHIELVDAVFEHASEFVDEAFFLLKPDPSQEAIRKQRENDGFEHMDLRTADIFRSGTQRSYELPAQQNETTESKDGQHTGNTSKGQ